MLHLLIQTLAAAVATVGFSLLFGVPARYYPSCAMIGGVGWLAYLLLLPYSSVSIATYRPDLTPLKWRLPLYWGSCLFLRFRKRYFGLGAGAGET